MTSGLKPYPEMKDSGVDSLGSVPSHWEVGKLGHIGRLFKGNGASKEDEVLTGIPCIRYGDLYTRHNYFILDSRACISEERASDYTPIEFGDILFAASGETIDEIGKSAVNLIRGRAYCGGDVIVFRPKRGLDRGYMGYATDFRPAVIQKARMGRGFTVVHIYGDELKKLAVPLPPVHEQSDIARFLDQAERRFHRYIRAKQTLIALLEEQKKSIIQQAVTGQIDVRTGKAYTTYRDSGIEWVGKIPSNWEVRRIGGFSTVGNGSTPSRSNPEYWANGRHGWVTSSAVNLGTINKAEEFVTDTAVRQCHLPPVKAGSVLIGITGQGKTRGMAAMLGIDVTINQHIAYITPNPRLVQPKYLQLFLTCAYAELRAISSASGSTRPALTCEDIKQFRVAIPSGTEQKHLLEVLANVVARTDRGIRHVRSQCVLADELRTRLIADVVTGKLDVRKASTKLTSSDDDGDEREPSVASGYAGTSKLTEPCATAARSEV